MDFINEKSKKYLSNIDLILENKNKSSGLTDAKIKAMLKNINKFFEFVYYLVVNDKEDVQELSRNIHFFMKLREKIDNNRKFLELQDKDFEVFEMVEKILKLAVE